jgi:transcriptional regulator with XRE-family HTH domain
MEKTILNIPEILQNIRNYRKNKGFSHDYMALELNISPSTYTKIERNEVNLSLERFLRITKILETPPSSFLENKRNTVIIQNNNDFENAYVENLQQDKEHITSLKEEICFLRKIIEQSRE